MTGLEHMWWNYRLFTKRLYLSPSLPQIGKRKEKDEMSQHNETFGYC